MFYQHICEALTDRTHLLALPVSPRDPAASIAAVLNLVHLGELVSDAARVTPLGAHEGDEVERAQVDLEKLLQAVWLHCYLWTPSAIALLKVQPERKGGWMFILELQQGKKAGRKIMTEWRGKGERKVKVSAVVDFRT